ncbi:MAG: hypothetical protein AB8B96_14045 [Lysobacterales bacterium]
MTYRYGHTARRQERQQRPPMKAKAVPQRDRNALSPPLIAGVAVVLVLLLIVRSGTGAF